MISGPDHNQYSVVLVCCAIVRRTAAWGDEDIDHELRLEQTWCKRLSVTDFQPPQKDIRWESRGPRSSRFVCDPTHISAGASGYLTLSMALCRSQGQTVIGICKRCSSSLRRRECGYSREPSFDHGMLHCHRAYTNTQKHSRFEGDKR